MIMRIVIAMYVAIIEFSIFNYRFFSILEQNRRTLLESIAWSLLGLALSALDTWKVPLPKPNLGIRQRYDLMEGVKST